MPIYVLGYLRITKTPTCGAIDLIKSQQLHGIKADEYLNKFPGTPTSSSSPLKLEIPCFI